MFVFTNLSLTYKQTKNTLNGKWKLICFQDLETNIQNCKPIDDPTRFITLTFSDNGQTGTMIGNTTINKVTGDYKLLEDNKIKVERFGGTKINEIGWGSNFWTTIYQSTSYNYSFDTLIIYYDSDSKAMKFINAD